MTLYKKGEEILKNSCTGRIKVLLDEWGQDIVIYKQTEDVYTDVYGYTAKADISLAGSTVEIIGIFVSDDFFSQDSLSAGGFQNGFLYTYSDQVEIGDVVALKRDDNKNKFYKVEQQQVIGMTQAVTYRYSISAVEK